jgi:hypothetical protein
MAGVPKHRGTEHSALILLQRHQLHHRPRSLMCPPNCKGPITTTQTFGTCASSHRPSTMRAHPRLREEPGAWAAHHLPTTTNSSTSTRHQSTDAPSQPSRGAKRPSPPHSPPQHAAPSAATATKHEGGTPSPHSTAPPSTSSSITGTSTSPECGTPTAMPCSSPVPFYERPGQSSWPICIASLPPNLPSSNAINSDVTVGR